MQIDKTRQLTLSLMFYENKSSTSRLRYKNILYVVIKHLKWLTLYSLRLGLFKKKTSEKYHLS